MCSIFSGCRPGLPLGIVALCSIFAVAPVRGAIERTVEKSFAVAPGGTLDARTFGGSITIQTGPADTVRIVVHESIDASDDAAADRILQDLDLKLEAKDNTVVVSAEYKGSHLGWLHRNPIRVAITATVPASFNAKAHTSGGNVEVGDLSGKVDVHTSGGNIQFGHLSGESKADTSGGNIVIEEAGAAVHAHTSGGNILLKESAAAGDLNTSGGDIRIERAGGPVQAHTSGGRVTAQFTVAPTADCTLSTSGGNVHVTLPTTAAVTLDAHTSGGQVKTALPVTIVGTHDKHHLRGTINGGGAKLTLRTSGGNISIEER